MAEGRDQPGSSFLSSHVALCPVSCSLGPELGGTVWIIFTLDNASVMAMQKAGFTEIFSNLLLVMFIPSSDMSFSQVG